MKIIILGTAYPFRGGLATFNERLARQLQAEGHQVEVITFTLQYPSFLFPGKTQYSSEQPPTDLHITQSFQLATRRALHPPSATRFAHYLLLDGFLRTML